MRDGMTIRRFKQGDRVRVIRPGADLYPDTTGIVASVTSADNVYRYVVEFQDGRSETFFGFELRPEGPVARKES